MARFHFITQWALDARVEEVYEIIKDSSSLSRWWPSVYLNVKTIYPGLANGVGKKVALLTRGYLPYTLRWDFEVIQIIPCKKIVLDAFGDLEGRGTWTFTPEEKGCLVVFDWDIRFRKKGLAWLSFLLRPVFRLNHRWAMKQGYESIKEEIRIRWDGEGISSQ